MTKKGISIIIIIIVSLCMLSVGATLTYSCSNNSNFYIDKNTEDSTGTQALKISDEPERNTLKINTREYRSSSRAGEFTEQTVHGGSWLDSFEDDSGIDLGLSDNYILSQGNIKIITPLQPKEDANTVALWHFDETSGATAYDETSNSNDGTIDGASRITGRFGNGYSFDGSNDYVQVPDDTSLQLSDEITVYAIVNVSLGTDYNVYGYRQILSKGATFQDKYSDYSLGLTNPVGAFMWESATSTNSPQTTSGTEQLSQGTWHVVAATFKGGVVKLYEDGYLVNTKPLTHSTLRTSTEDFFIGHRYTTNNVGAFQGGIDEVWISDIARKPPLCMANITTKEIVLPADMCWDTLLIDKTESLSSYLNITILNASDNQPISGTPEFTNEGEFDISHIDPLKYPSIKLTANFIGNTWGVTPILNSWGVSWNATNAWRDSFFKSVKIHSLDGMKNQDGLSQCAVPFKTYGYMNSSVIEIPEKSYYDTILINKTTPAGTNLNFLLFDALSGMTIPGFDDLTGSKIDISSIDPEVYTNIQLRAVFRSYNGVSPQLFDWSLNWTGNTPPYKINITSSDNEVYRTQGITLNINGFDNETLESLMDLEVKYQPPDSIVWDDKNLDNVRYENNEWLVDFTPQGSFTTGWYKFKITFTDAFGAYYIKIFDNVVNVKNNLPGKPQLQISPQNPRTGDDFEISANSFDIEGETVTYSYQWFKNGELQADLITNKISSIYSKKGESWRCEVVPNDGNVNGDGPSNSTYVVISNTPPVVNISIADVKMKEDQIDDSSIILSKNFFDIDGDKLNYSCTGQEHLEVLIDQATGAVTLIPVANWFGEEELIFKANDSLSDANDAVKVEVEPQNDAPELIRAGSVEVSSPLDILKFDVFEDSQLNLTLITVDIDGDTVTCVSNRTDNIGVDDITEISITPLDFNQYLLTFLPENKHVGEIPLNISIYDSNGSRVFYFFTIEVYNTNDPPSVSLEFPINGTHFEEDESIYFECNYDDPDLLIPANNETLMITWTWMSNNRTETFAGGEFLNNLTDKKFKPGTYEIIVTVQDQAGAESKAKRTIIIEEPEEEVKVRRKPSSDTFFSWWHFILIWLIMMILFLAVFMAMRRRRRKAEEEVEYIPPGEPKAALPGTIVAKPGAIQAPTITMDQIPAPTAPDQLPVSAEAGVPVQVSASLQAAQGAAPQPGVVPVPISTAVQPHTAPQPQLPPGSEQIQQVTEQEASVQPEVKEAVVDQVQAPDPAVVPATQVPTPVQTQPTEGDVKNGGAESHKEPEQKESGVNEQLSENKEILNELEKISELKTLGLMTEEEFEIKKQELLKRL